MRLSNKFIIVIAVYNGASCIINAIESVIMQKFDDLGIIIRDDASNDGTPIIIKNFLGMPDSTNHIKFQGKDVLIIKNETKLYGGGNTYDSAINNVCNRESIIGVLDGDDCLLDDCAVQKINRIYEERNMWQVWSQHYPKSKIHLLKDGYSNPLPDDLFLYSSRDYWSVSHFRTCKAWLFNHIERADLIDPFDNYPFYRYAGDAAFLYPLIELCGNERCFFLNEPLYLYSDDLMTNDHNKSKENMEKYTLHLKNVAKRYQKLPTKPIA